jgi:hypothetical protein
MRGGLDRERHFEGLGVELAVGHLYVQGELRLRLLDQALGRTRILEAEILDVLAVQGERCGGACLGGLAGGRGGRRRGGRHGAFSNRLGQTFCCGAAVPCRAALHKLRAGSGARQLPKHGAAVTMNFPLFARSGSP